ncbi:recombinase family protein [Phascolarctobacterium succinatutens]|uniref:recombinase family protein n=1 Tax=Phascolarctobacterium succinatutens TaxID=626940 RepID=UPI0026EB6FE4|nr:recombinase family protein [Phascolarctobacterium succinatutens]
MLNAVFSSDMQREESIDAQVSACKNYCQSKGYLVIGQYVDEAKSGRSTLTRDAYNQMMADAMENKFDVIIFHKIDRNSRNELNYFIFKDKLEKLGIRYEYAAQPIDANTAEGQMIEAMLVSIAAYYSSDLVKETKRGLNENAYKAQFNGGYAPLGYKLVDKHYVIDEQELSYPIQQLLLFKHKKTD